MLDKDKITMKKKIKKYDNVEEDFFLLNMYFFCFQ